MIKRIISFIQKKYILLSPTNFVNHLRKMGVEIGEGTYMQDPKTTKIDISRPSLVTIGKNCFFNSRFELYTHDWVTHVFIHSDRNFVNSSGRVTIGDNVAFGTNVMVLKGVTIGDNCFIGANSVVTKDIPKDSIAIGAPAKVVMSLEDYYQLRLKKGEEEAFEYARSIQERYKRKPVPADFWEEFYLFVNGNEVDRYPEIPIRRQLGPIYDRYVKTHQAKYANFDDFINAAGTEEKHTMNI